MEALEMERKITQLDNDVRDIHSVLHEIAGTQRRHGNRLDELAAVLDQHSATLVVHGDRLRQLDAKVDQLDTKVDQLDTKVDTVIDLLRGGPAADGG
jgi:outer membrane murein-binding lipoprotein Lpp